MEPDTNANLMGYLTIGYQRNMG